MEDMRYYEEVEVDEFEEAMAGFEEWLAEQAQGLSFDEWEACFLAELEKNA